MCLKTAYAFHILNSAKCDACERVINKETVAVSRFCAQNNTTNSSNSKYCPRFVETPERTITWTSLLDDLKLQIQAYVESVAIESGARKTAAKEGNEYFKVD